MLWMGVGVTLVGAIVVIVLMHTKHPADELGSVSANWIAEHRAER